MILTRSGCANTLKNSAVNCESSGIDRLQYYNIHILELIDFWLAQFKGSVIFKKNLRECSRLLPSLGLRDTATMKCFSSEGFSVTRPQESRACGERYQDL